MRSVFGAASLAIYREHLAACVTLDREEERNLARRWREGDRSAGNRIIQTCLPFIISITIEYQQ